MDEEELAALANDQFRALFAYILANGGGLYLYPEPITATIGSAPGFERSFWELSDWKNGRWWRADIVREPVGELPGALIGIMYLPSDPGGILPGVPGHLHRSNGVVYFAPSPPAQITRLPLKATLSPA